MAKYYIVFSEETNKYYIQQVTMGIFKKYLCFTEFFPKEYITDSWGYTNKGIAEGAWERVRHMYIKPPAVKLGKLKTVQRLT